MTMNLIQLSFTVISLTTGYLGLLIVTLESYLPKFITRTYKFGKFAEKAEHPLVIKCEVPKRWFKHFYILAAPLSIYVSIVTINLYFYNGNVPERLLNILNFLIRGRKALVSAECTTIAMILITIQSCKRFYETQFISVFSDANINVFHYLLGFIHYVGTILSIIGESEGFVEGTTASFNWSKITSGQIFLIVVFLLSSYMQLRANYILASLRKNKKDLVVTNSYKIPHGELFEYVSSPLQLTEILMYVSLSIILWSSTTYHFVTFWVVVNQTSCAVLAQKWYHQTFQSYPKKRKILLPYLF